MPLAITLFSDADGLDGWIEESMPWLGAWLLLLAVVLVIILIGQGIAKFRSRSPVEKLLRRRA